MRDHRVVARNQLSYHIGEEHAVAERNVILNNAGLTVFPRYDKVARMCHRRFATRHGDEQQRNGLLEHRPPRQINESTILKKCRVEGPEGIALDVRIATEMWLNRA